MEPMPKKVTPKLMPRAGMSARQAKPSGAGFHSPSKYTKRDRRKWRDQQREVGLSGGDH
jgi:hypothetical protein